MLIKIKLLQLEKEFSKQLSANLEITKTIIVDKSDARQMNNFLNKHKQTPWLVKNTGSLIALITTLFTFGLWFAMLLDFTTGVNENILFAINSGLTLSFGYVLSFYFGSSKNESDLQKSKIHREEANANLNPTTITDEEIEIK